MALVHATPGARSVDYLRAIYTDWPSIGVFNGDTDAWSPIWKELTEN
jgi:hypothetical protein